MTQYAYHSGPLAEVKTIITSGNGRTVVLTYKPPLTGARVAEGLSSEPPAAVLVDVPASVEIKFINGTIRTFSAENGEWITEIKHGKKEHGAPTSPVQRHPNNKS